MSGSRVAYIFVVWILPAICVAAILAEIFVPDAKGACS